MHSNSVFNTETDPAPPNPTHVNNVVASQPSQPATTSGMGVVRLIHLRSHMPLLQMMLGIHTLLLQMKLALYKSHCNWC